MSAFRRAREDGALWVETDVKLTYDGVPILMHDETLDRTTNGKGFVANINWSNLSQLDAGSWFDVAYENERVPMLSDLVRFVAAESLRLNLELKPCPGRTRATVMVALIELSKIWPEKAPPPLISSFDVEALIIAANLQPECPRGLLLDEWREDWAELSKRCEAYSLHLKADSLTRDRVTTLKESGKAVLAYVVNEPARVKELLQWGVSAVFSDDPATVLKSL